MDGYDHILFSGRDSVVLVNSAGMLMNCSSNDGRERWSLDTSACDSVQAIGQSMVFVYGEGLVQRIQVRR